MPRLDQRNELIEQHREWIVAVRASVPVRIRTAVDGGNRKPRVSRGGEVRKIDVVEREPMILAPSVEAIHDAGQRAGRHRDRPLHRKRHVRARQRSRDDRRMRVGHRAIGTLLETQAVQEVRASASAHLDRSPNTDHHERAAYEQNLSACRHVVILPVGVRERSRPQWRSSPHRRRTSLVRDAGRQFLPGLHSSRSTRQ